MRSVEFVLSGLAAGAFSGMLGVGGALLATPLIRFLGVSPYLAVGTTVPVMVPTTLTGAWTYWRAKLVDLRVAGWAAASGSVTAVAGAATTRQVNGHVLMLLTAFVLIVLSLRLLPSGEESDLPPRRGALLVLAIGGVSGYASGLLGIGGGFIMVPAFAWAVRLPLKTAIGTSLAVITLTAIPNVAAQAFVGNIDWRVAGLLALGVIPGARLGATTAIRAPDKTIRRLVRSGILLVAVFYAIVELRALFSS